MKILVGSENPVKIDAVREAFSKYFENLEVLGLKVDSKVPDQPIGQETFLGAENRALALIDLSKKKGDYHDFFVGLESGIINLHSRWFTFGAVCIIDKFGRKSFGTSIMFELPNFIVKQLLERVELGRVMDELTGEENTKQKGGAVGFFTKGVMNRKELYVDGVVAALIPLLNEDLFFKGFNTINK